jgi:uncharacterized membrane protein YhaH (DUF805 family)
MPAAQVYRPIGWLVLALKPLRDTLVFTGRSTRSEVIAFFVLNSLMNTATLIAGPSPSQSLLAVMIVWQILWSLPWIALFVRRLHDQGRPAWWSLLMAIEAAVALPLLALREPGADSFLNLTGSPLATVLTAIFLASMLTQLVLMLLPGTLGPNRYSADPRDT